MNRTARASFSLLALAAGCVSVEEEERMRLEQARFYYDEGSAFYEEAKVQTDRAAAQEKFDLADQSFTSAIEYRPTFAEAYARRGHVHFRQGEDSLAIGDYSTALEIDPSQEECLYNRGEAFRRLAARDSTKAARALRDFQEFHRANPSHAESLLRIGWILYEHAPSRWREARKFLARYLEVAGPAANSNVANWIAAIDKELGPPPEPTPSAPAPPTPHPLEDFEPPRQPEPESREPAPPDQPQGEPPKGGS